MNFHGKCDTNITFCVSSESGFRPERLFPLSLYFGEMALKGLVGLPEVLEDLLGPCDVFCFAQV